MTVELVPWLIAGATVLAAVVAIVLTVRRSAQRTRTDPASAASAAAVDAAIARLEGELGARVRSVDERLAELTSVFVNDRARGNWGELTLARILEQSGLRPGQDYELQLSGDAGRPDAVIHLPGDRRIVVDAKFPVARFAEALATEDADERRRLLRSHGADLVKEAKGLARRGYHQLAAGGYVVMYLPNESLYATTLAEYPELYEEIVAARVFLAGPSTLLALLLTVGHLVAEQRAVVAAREILDDARELRSRLEVFLSHLDKVGRGLSNAVGAYNKAVGSWTSRLVPQADRLCRQAALDEPSRPTPVEVVARPTLAESAPSTPVDPSDLRVAG